MIKRALMLLGLLVFLLAVAWFNPLEDPHPAKNPHYVKIGHDGQQMGAWRGPWSCVFDRRTGLMWEVKSYAEDLHDLQCSFTWFDGRTGVADGGSCFTAGGHADTQDLIDFTNTETRCGAKGWRLPTEYELTSLLIKDPLPGDVLIALDYFPYTQRGLYWTSDIEVPLTGHFQYLGKGAISVSFNSGLSGVMPYRDAAFVRLVTKRQF